MRKYALLVHAAFRRREVDVLLLVLLRERALSGPLRMPLDANIVLAQAHAFPIGQAHQINPNGDVAVISRELRRAERVDEPVLPEMCRKAVINGVGPNNRRSARQGDYMLVAPDDVSDFGEPVVVRAVLAIFANITIVPEGGRLEALGDPQRREVDGVVGRHRVEEDAPPTDDGTVSSNVGLLLTGVP